MLDNQQDHQEPHDMILAATDETGAEEWYCPTCGRRFLMYWPPNYHKVILEPGDEQISHRGGKSGARLDASTVDSPPSDAFEADPNLQPYIQWMEQVDFSRLWQ